MNALVAILVGLLGPFLGAVYWILSRASERRKTAFTLIERYNSSEMFVVRAVAWKVQEAWHHGDRSILKFFVVSNEPPPKGVTCANGLTEDQNLAWFLHFFGNLAQYQREGLVSKKLISVFFGQHYYTYRSFLLEFMGEFRRHAPDNQPWPSWMTGLPQLERIFDTRDPRSAENRSPTAGHS